MAAPFDTLETAVTAARVRVNDAIASIGGDILTDNAGFTAPIVNIAWRRVQTWLADMGFGASKGRATLTAIPAAGTTDPFTFTSISWTGTYDGAASAAGPVLPDDLISPLELWERVSGPTNPTARMDNCPLGLPPVPKGPLNKLWEWRRDQTNWPGQQTINVPGATGETDILLIYNAFLPDFVPATTTPFTSQPIPIMFILSPFSSLIAAEFCRARGDLDVAQWEQMAVMELGQIFNRDLAQGRSLQKESELQKMRGPYTPSYAPDPRNEHPGGKA